MRDKRARLVVMASSWNQVGGEVISWAWEWVMEQWAS